MIIFQTKKEFNKNGVIEDSFEDLQATCYDELAAPDSEEVAEAKRRWSSDLNVEIGEKS